jgi:hypothetical protein
MREQLGVREATAYTGKYATLPLDAWRRSLRHELSGSDVGGSCLLSDYEMGPQETRHGICAAGACCGSGLSTF